MVCGPGAFIVLKALAFRSRGLPKDAYDLYYVTRNYGSAVDEVAARFIPLLKHREARETLDILRSDFREANGVGPIRVAHFVELAEDAEIRQDVAGFMSRLVEVCEGAADT